MTRTIKSIKKPENSKVGYVNFEDGTSAKFWQNATFGEKLEAGVTAECVTESKKDNYGKEEDWLKQWGQASAPRAGGGGNRFQGRSKEEICSIAFQSCLKSAVELHGLAADPRAVADSTRVFFRLHNFLVYGEKL